MKEICNGKFNNIINCIKDCKDSCCFEINDTVE